MRLFTIELVSFAFVLNKLLTNALQCNLLDSDSRRQSGSTSLLAVPKPKSSLTVVDANGLHSVVRVAFVRSLINVLVMLLVVLAVELMSALSKRL